MVVISIDADNFVVNARTNQVATVANDLFGGVATTQLKNTWEPFTKSVDHLDLSHIRWPGGTLSESGYFDPTLTSPTIRLIEGSPPAGWIKGYSIDYPDLVHPQLLASGSYVGFSSVLAYAVEHNLSLTINLPVEEMYEDSFSTQVSSVHQFLETLFASNCEELSNLNEPLIISVGNEQYDAPEAYAKSIVATLTAVDAFRAVHSGSLFQLAIQSMNDLDNSRVFLDKIKSFDQNSLLSNIDLVRHHFLNIGLMKSSIIETTPDRTIPVNELVDLIEGTGGRTTPVKLYASAFSPGSLDVPTSFDEAGSHFQSGEPLSLAAAASLVSLVAGFVELGYSYGAIWGLGSTISQSSVASFRDGGMKFSPAAEAYRMMAENTRGMTLLNSPNLDDNRTNADVFHYSFADSSKVVIFLAADDLPENSLNIELILQNFGGIGNAWIERVVVEDGTVGPATSKIQALSIADGLTSVQLGKDFDFVMLTVLREQPGASYLHAWGSEEGEALRAGSGGALIESNGGDDTLVGGAGADFLTGGAGNDLILGGAGADSLVGGAGADAFVLRADGGTIQILDFEVGVDRIDLSSWFLSHQTDELRVDSTADGAIIQMGLEQLVITASSGLPIALDQLLASDLTSLWGRDVESFKIAKVINASWSDQNVQGTEGSETFVINPGAKIVNGGDGFDLVDYRNTASSLFVDLIYQNLNRGVASGNSFISIEGVIGGAGSDNIRGNINDNRLNGQQGVDWIFGRRGNDILDGGAGNDVLLGGVGEDTLLGGSGKDRAQYSESQTSVVVDLQLNEQNTGEAEGDMLIGIEDLAGSSFGDFLFGDSHFNGLFGRDGNDFLDGRAGNDYLNGGAGRDTLVGGAGNDTLRGGTHTDVFIFESGNDVIEDFRVSDLDELKLNSQLLTSILSVEDYITSFAVVVDGNVVLNFDSGGSLKLEHLSSLVGLPDMISFF